MLSKLRERIFKIQRRSYEYGVSPGLTKSKTGFDRVLEDKLIAFGIDKRLMMGLSLMSFATLGLSYLMSEDNFNYIFGYSGKQNNLYKPMVSQFSTNNQVNAIWTVATYMWAYKTLEKGLNTTFAVKLMFIGIFCTWITLSSVMASDNPKEVRVGPFDSASSDKTHRFGGHGIAMTFIFYWLIKNRMYSLGGAVAFIDIWMNGFYYVGGHIAGTAAALMF